MQSYDFLLTIALILLSTKFLGGMSTRVNMPQVVGALLAGIILGPSVIGLMSETDFLIKSSEIGVIILMFTAGLDTDAAELKKTGVASLVIACVGVVLPLLGGFVVYRMFFYSDGDPYTVLKAVFMGIILTATSVSITVETLREMGKIDGRVGTSIMGAAVIDDILGIILLTVTIGFKDPSVDLRGILLRILLYFLFIGIAGVVMNQVFRRFDVRAVSMQRQRVAIYALVCCLLLAYLSEEAFGIADITGAYFAGLFLCNTGETRTYIVRKMSVSSYMFFSPIFFAGIGIKTDLQGMTGTLFLFSIVLLAAAVFTKAVGCGLGAKFCRYGNWEAVNVGVGMVSRGEVALIVAQKGAEAGLVDPSVFPAIILMVIATTLLTPICLNRTMRMVPQPSGREQIWKPDLPVCGKGCRSCITVPRQYRNHRAEKNRS